MICNDGVTYTASLEKFEEVIAPVGPSVEDAAEKDDETEENVTEKPAMSFSDVAASAWYYDSVKYAYENDLMTGVSENAFAPAANTTRGQIVTILWRLAGEPAPQGNNLFTDVAIGSYYETAVTWAAEQGIVTGVSAAEFAPDANITREQLAAVLFRYAQYRGMAAVVLSENLWFNDADQISPYAVSAMNWAVYEELISGTGNGNVEPKSFATRAQVATILARFCQNVQ